MEWKQLLAYITGSVDQELLVRNEYLVTENRILRQQITGRIRLSDGERKTLAAIGKKLERQALAEVATIVKPETILAWHRTMVAKKFDGSPQRKALGRPKSTKRWKPWSCAWPKKIAPGATTGSSAPWLTAGSPSVTRPWATSSSAMVWHLLPSARRPPRGKSLSVRIWTLGGLVTYYVLFFIRLGTREVHVAGVTPHPNHAWMRQIARNITMEQWGFLAPGQYLIHDRDGKYGPTFHQIIDAAGVTRVPLPPRSPNLNAYAERWVRSVKEECLARMILFGEASLRHALRQYVEHFHSERNHQGKSNVLLFPAVSQDPACEGPIQCRERLGGLLKYYERKA
jgi:transposase InsO family protein